MSESDVSGAFGEILARLQRLIERQTGVAVAASGAGCDPLPEIRRALDRLDTAMVDAGLVESRRLSASILACAPLSIIVCDADGRIKVFSPGAEAMLGYRASEMLGQEALAIHDHEEVRVRSRELSRELGYAIDPGFAVFVAKPIASGLPDEHEWTYLCQDGTRITVLLSVTTLRNGFGEIDGYLCIATDITERTLALAEISRMAHHDQLTRIPNRRLFHDRMQMAISHARRENAQLALMLIDLDGFKPVNDRLGHPVGDVLLKAVAKRMQGCLRESDTLARVGGDEFAVILPRVVGAPDALVVAEKIRREINAPFELAGGYPISISCSIGVALYPEHGKDEKRLSKNADEAMYVAKAHGGDCTRLSTRVATAANPAYSEPLLLRLVWQDDYACGEAMVDQPRQEIFARASELIQTAQSGQYDARQLPAALDAFIAGLAGSLASEEAVLAQHHYGGLAEHALQHQKLVGRAVELCHRVGEVTLGELLAFLAQEVVVRHLLDEDRLYFSLFRREHGAAALASHEL